MNVQGEMGSGRRVHPWVLEKFSSGNPGSRGLPSDSAIRPDGGLGGSGTTGNVRYPLFFTGVRHDVPIGQHFIQMADIRSDSSIMAKSRSNIFGAEKPVCPASGSHGSTFENDCPTWKKVCSTWTPNMSIIAKKLSVIPQFMFHHRPAVPTSDGEDPKGWVFLLIFCLFFY